VPAPDWRAADSTTRPLLQKQLQFPHGVDVASDDGQRMCSMDGDADRLVYFYAEAGRLVLLDGDKIAALAAKAIVRLLGEAGLADDLSIGLVQTAYANGASTLFFREMVRRPPRACSCIAHPLPAGHRSVRCSHWRQAFACQGP